MVQKASPKLLEMMNEVIAREIQVSIQYMWQHVMATKPAPIDVGKDIKEMLRLDVGAEEEAITLYKDIIKLAGSEGDSTTRLLFEEILSDEEDHHDTFTTLLEE